MKKVIATLLTMVTVLSMAVPTFAYPVNQMNLDGSISVVDAEFSEGQISKATDRFYNYNPGVYDHFDEIEWEKYKEHRVCAEWWDWDYNSHRTWFHNWAELYRFYNHNDRLACIYGWDDTVTKLRPVNK